MDSLRRGNDDGATKTMLVYALWERCENREWISARETQDTLIVDESEVNEIFIHLTA